LRTDSRFWNVSGIQVGLGAGGLKVQMQSIQALFSGGVAFGLPDRRRELAAPVAPANSVFKLYTSQEDADSARYHQRLRVATYIDTSVKGLAAGSQVSMFGLQVGTVTAVKLQIPSPQDKPRVRVEMQIEPERMMPEWKESQLAQAKEYLAAFVANGMRASVQSASFLTGESMIGLQFVKNAPPLALTYEGDVAIMPSQP
ncbi:paraquat-inducible protein B, partial [Gluconobacter japonicus]